MAGQVRPGRSIYWAIGLVSRQSVESVSRWWRRMPWLKFSGNCCRWVGGDGRIVATASRVWRSVGRMVAIALLPARKIAQNTFARHPTLAAAFSLLHSVESGVLLLRLLLQKLLAVARLLLFSRKLLDFVVVVKVVVVVEHPTLHPTLMRVGCKVGCSTTTTTFTTTTKSNNFRENNNNLATANNFCNNNRNSNTPLSTECKRENAAAKVGCLAKVFCAIFRAGRSAIATIRPTDRQTRLAVATIRPSPPTHRQQLPENFNQGILRHHRLTDSTDCRLTSPIAQ